MQGYENPLVCKEVFLPCDPNFLTNEPTIEQYKDKYGIDLNEIFDFVFDDDNKEVILYEKGIYKLYLVDVGIGGYSVKMPNKHQGSPYAEGRIILGFADADISSGFGLNFNFDSSEKRITSVSMFEI